MKTKEEVKEIFLKYPSGCTTTSGNMIHRTDVLDCDDCPYLEKNLSSRQCGLTYKVTRKYHNMLPSVIVAIQKYFKKLDVIQEILK